MIDRRYRAVQRELARVRRRKRLRHYWMPVVLTAVACLVLMRFVVGINVVSGMSMAPALLPGDFVFGLRWARGVQDGDLVIVREPSGDQMVKRVAGIAGDTLDITPDGHLIRNGDLVQEPGVWYGGQDTSQWIDFPVTLQEGYIFCLGDNRPLSLDSRQRAIGPVALDQVEGHILFVLRGQH